MSSSPTPQPTLALNPIRSQSVNEGATVSFTATASGSTAALTYSLGPGAPAGATIDPVTGLFTWTPTAPGQYSVTVQATENSSSPQSDTETVSITVNDVAPAVQLNPALAVTEAATFRDTGSFASETPGSFVADVDYGDGTGLQPLPLGPSGTFVLDHTYTRPGTYIVTVGVQDALGVVGKADLTLTATATALVSGYGRGRDAFVIGALQEGPGAAARPGGAEVLVETPGVRGRSGDRGAAHLGQPRAPQAREKRPRRPDRLRAFVRGRLGGRAAGHPTRPAPAGGPLGPDDQELVSGEGRRADDGLIRRAAGAACGEKRADRPTRPLARRGRTGDTSARNHYHITECP